MKSSKAQIESSMQFLEFSVMDLPFLVAQIFVSSSAHSHVKHSLVPLTTDEAIRIPNTQMRVAKYAMF
jgi:hypothetical protein